MIDEGILNHRLYENYLQHLKQIDEIDYSGDRPHLSCEDVLDAHYLIAEHFRKLGEGIGGFGPKDMSLLASSVGRQLASAGGNYVYEDFWEIAAALIIGLVTNHPFHDANKRTAFLCSAFFMLEHRFVPRVEISQVEDFTVDVANFHMEHGRHPKVEDIAPNFKTMFRREDASASYVITYRELRRILEQHGCSLRNPKGNFIDVYRGESKVLKIGYPSEKKEVGRKALMSVRTATGLTKENGYDAQVFFKGEDPLRLLIGEYQEVLKRLADR